MKYNVIVIIIIKDITILINTDNKNTKNNYKKNFSYN